MIIDNNDIRLNSDLVKNINLVINLYEDSFFFLEGKIKVILKEYIDSIQPIFFKELINYVNKFNYPWHTPGHGGGVMFMKNPIGKMLLDFYGEKTLRSDLSISVPELGSLLDEEDQELGMFHFGGSTHCLFFGPQVELEFNLHNQTPRLESSNISVNAHLATVKTKNKYK